MPGRAFDPHRRRLLAGAGATVLWCTSGAARAGLEPTPRQTRGPFYPQELPLDRDNDLVRVDARADVAHGAVTDLHGRVVDRDGQPVDDARIEIWQCDATGHYHHRLAHSGRRDPGFQGFGTTTTGTDGGYRFRTIRPVPYPGRAPHIHFRVVAPGRRELITQMYVAGHPRNVGDPILAAAGPDRDRLIVDFRPAGGPAAELRARFDIVVPR